MWGLSKGLLCTRIFNDFSPVEKQKTFSFVSAFSRSQKEDTYMAYTNFQVKNLPVHIHDTRAESGKAAAEDAARRINDIIAKNGVANLVFAAAPSQNDLLENLLKHDIDWTKVRGFHQDEYVGIAEDEPAGFGNFMRRAIFDKVPFKELHFMYSKTGTPQEQCDAYAAKLKQYPIDLIFLGFGENGHMAFNDPDVADFNDPYAVKLVQLDDICRQQQVNDGCFPSIDAVPTHAMTMTLSFIMSVPQAICVVPTVRKADAVYNALRGEVTTRCPGSILRNHPNAALYLDSDSASRL
jgi:glucosamine-6-phosphate deaminase